MRVRLDAIAAQASQALFAQSFPDGRCSKGPPLRSAMTCSTIACPRVSLLRREQVHGAVVEHGVVPVDGEQPVLVRRVHVRDRRTIRREVTCLSFAIELKR